MKGRIFLVISLIFGLLVVIISVGRITVSGRITDSDKDVQNVSLRVGGLDREFLLYKPGTVSGGSRVPVVFLFHGGGGTSRHMMDLSRFNEIAERERFIVVYPQAINREWKDGRAEKVSRPHRENIDDVAFFDEMLKWLNKNHKIDERRIFAAGISNGAMFSHYLAAKRSEKISAIAAVVGGITEPADREFSPLEPVSVLIIQGTEDRLVPYDGGRIVSFLRRDRGSIISTDDAVRLWTDANGCESKPVVSMLPDRDPNDCCRVEASKWSDCRNGSKVWLYKVIGGGHAWPGGRQYATRRLIGRVPNDINSNSIWEFFETNAPKRIRTKKNLSRR